MRLTICAHLFIQETIGMSRIVLLLIHCLTSPLSISRKMFQVLRLCHSMFKYRSEEGEREEFLLLVRNNLNQSVVDVDRVAIIGLHVKILLHCTQVVKHSHHIQRIHWSKMPHLHTFCHPQLIIQIVKRLWFCFFYIYI